MQWWYLPLVILLEANQFLKQLHLGQRGLVSVNAEIVLTVIRLWQVTHFFEMLNQSFSLFPFSYTVLRPPLAAAFLASLASSSTPLECALSFPEKKDSWAIACHSIPPDQVHREHGAHIPCSNADGSSGSQKALIQIPDFLSWAFIQNCHGATFFVRVC